MALPGLMPIRMIVAVVKFSTSDHPLGGAPEEVPCAEAPAFGGAKLRGFRMPRKDVRDWLATTCPVGPEPKTQYCSPDFVGLCLHLEFQEGSASYARLVPGAAGPGFGAHAADVTVTYEGPERALVRFSAFTT
ncbi:hypothetical protein [Streptomyces cyanogenus]|uniref:Uncharacterized protein n=1 Tax=Streptomyces cyanogenus TaxID=80860 RepID=A0ABX7TYW5_STRCY|nr:hypothetical protein [Streptomyces cyanogenus]QTD99884.1 hypothetical protein S1361_21285 [Streptomyces cyanogenus]